MSRRGTQHDRGAHGGRGAPSGRGGGQKTGAKRPPKTRDEMISRSLSLLLRHKAEEEGVRLDDGGWAVVTDVLLWRKMASLHVTLPELQSVVYKNDKQRFQLKEKPSPPPGKADPTTDPSCWLIRASQGHSITTIDSDKLLSPLTATDPQCPNLVVHGTYPHFWKDIKRSGGLMPISRNHIHFATKEPDRFPPAGEKIVKEKVRSKDEGPDQVMSGMRTSATILIWVDVKRSMAGGVKWWRSQNNVYLTDGLEAVVVEKDGGRSEGRKLGFEWVRWVEVRGTREILWRNEDVDVEGERRENELRRNGIASSSGVKGDEGLEDELRKMKVSPAPEVQGGSKGIEEGTGSREAVRLAKEAIKESWDD